jgi:hypothetical protein
MAVPLAAHIHLVPIGADLVLLDMRADAYVCVPDGLAQLRPSADRACLSPADETTLAELVDAGLVEPELCSARRAPPPLPLEALPPREPQPLRTRELLRFVACLWDLLFRYRSRSLGAIVSFAAAAPAAPPDASPEIVRLAHLFQRWAIWLPMPRKCLVRSFVLLRFLQRSGLNAQWVLGVRTWPFSAHCWLQLGDIALDDAPDRLAAFEPIYVVG